MKTRIFFLLSLIMITGTLLAQTPALYSKGGTITVIEPTQIDGTVAAKATLYVKGTLVNTVNGPIIGTITNNGEIQVTGDWNQDGNAQLVSTGDEVFLGGNGTADTYNKLLQRITGNNPAAFTGSNYDFNNLVIRKPARTISNNSLVELGVNVEVSNLVTWVGAGGVIRTDITSRNDAGESYLYELYLKNPSPTSLLNYNTTIGSSDKFIEGKLRRQVDQTATYYFPIGVDPFTSGIGGLNAFELKFNNVPTNAGILGYLEKTNLYPIANNGVLFCDIGKDPTPGIDDPFNLCAGPPDGAIDKMIATKNQSYQWSATTNTPGSFNNYEVEVFPTAACEIAALGELIPSACGNPYQTLRMEWLAHNGIVGGTPTYVGYNTPFALTGAYICPTPNYKRITGQNGFSKFRLHGVQVINTVLPVELVSLAAKAIRNEFIQVTFQTASELNNRGFVIERSTDALIWDSIGWVYGHGTTNSVNNYLFDDYTALHNILYYYRLKQFDLDNRFKISKSVVAKITANDDVITVSEPVPNPSMGTRTITVYLPKSTNVSIQCFNDIGQVVVEQTIIGTAGNNSFTIQQLPKGWYAVKINIDNYQTVKKFIAQ